jgi:hypothetical protein
MQINHCKHIKRGRIGQRCAPYGGAARAPSKTARHNPLPELPTINTGSCNYRTPTNTATKKFSPIVQLFTYTHRPTETSHAWRPGGRMRHRDEGEDGAQPQSRDTPDLLACHHPLPAQIPPTSNSCTHNMLLDSATDNPQGIKLPPTVTRHLNGPPHTRGQNETRLIPARRPCALPQTRNSRRIMSPSALTPMQCKPVITRESTARESGTTGSDQEIGGSHATRADQHSPS